MLGGAAEGKTWSGAGRGGSAPAATERRALFLRCLSARAFFWKFFKCCLVLGKFLDWDRLQEIEIKNIISPKGRANIGVLLEVPWLLLIWSGSEVHGAAAGVREIHLHRAMGRPDSFRQCVFQKELSEVLFLPICWNL